MCLNLPEHFEVKICVCEDESSSVLSITENARTGLRIWGRGVHGGLETMRLGQDQMWSRGPHKALVRFVDVWMFRSRVWIKIFRFLSFRSTHSYTKFCPADQENMWRTKTEGLWILVVSVRPTAIFAHKINECTLLLLWSARSYLIYSFKSHFDLKCWLLRQILLFLLLSQNGDWRMAEVVQLWRKNLGKFCILPFWFRLVRPFIS